MRLSELKTIIENKVKDLEVRASLAQQSGDLENYIQITTELSETKTTLEELNK